MRNVIDKYFDEGNKTPLNATRLPKASPTQNKPASFYQTIIPRISNQTQSLQLPTHK
jgi:hypothetical protein